MTLNAEEIERAVKLENYLSDEKDKWKLEEDKKLLLLRCQLLGKCQGDLET